MSAESVSERGSVNLTETVLDTRERFEEATDIAEEEDRAFYLKVCDDMLARLAGS